MMVRTLILWVTCLAASYAQAAPVTHQHVNPDLERSLAVFFAAKPSAHGAIAEFIKVQHWPQVTGQVRWSLPPLRFLPKRVSLIAEQGRGKSLRRWYVPVEVKWMKNVIILQHDISARTVLDRSMLKQKRKNIAGLHGRTWHTLSDVEGLKTLRNMRRGDVVVSSFVKRPPLIKRGDHVTILVSLKGIQIRAEGVALKSGSRGDRMLVQNIRSKQRLQSIVQDAHTVSIAVGGV